jgi:hypothetical protein
MQEKEVKILFQLKKKMDMLIKSKKDQIDQFQDEITLLTQEIETISSLISTNSFSTAAEALVTSKMDAETLATQPGFSTNNVQYTRKIFSGPEEAPQSLLVVLKFHKDAIFIRFPNPTLSKITQERYIHDFVKPTLVTLKQIEKELTTKIEKNLYDAEEYLESILLGKIQQYESFEYVLESIKKLVLPKSI